VYNGGGNIILAILGTAIGSFCRTSPGYFCLSRGGER